LNDWKTKAAELKSQAEKAGGDVKGEVFKQVENLTTKQEEIQQQMNTLKDSSGEAWEEIKIGVDKVVEDVKVTWENVVAKFKKESAE
ncbi:MAG: PHP family Zn ribbon phosphoesterase, partial [bacterium]